uniref:Uncharacterized protein n=1 Tax=Arundo donax TaxID=35708 RepID=A0A0A9F3F1_ARUDO
MGLRAGEGGHGPRPEARRHRRLLSRRRRRSRRRIRERRGCRDRGGAESGVGEEAAGAGVPEQCGGGHCVAAAAREQRNGEEEGRWV